MTNIRLNASEEEYNLNLISGWIFFWSTIIIFVSEYIYRLCSIGRGILTQREEEGWFICLWRYLIIPLLSNIEFVKQCGLKKLNGSRNTFWDEKLSPPNQCRTFWGNHMLIGKREFLAQNILRTCRLLTTLIEILSSFWIFWTEILKRNITQKAFI